jgi:mRNA-degrading endonuclease RelE of RelBE toxin-antitoxin system
VTEQPEQPAPERIAAHWSPEARADLRSIDREPAMQILYCVDRYLASRTGDVKKLKPPLTSFRLRCGDYRVFFDLKTDGAIEITKSPTSATGRKPTADFFFSCCSLFSTSSHTGTVRRCAAPEIL